MDYESIQIPSIDSLLNKTEYVAAKSVFLEFAHLNGLGGLFAADAKQTLHS
jgi:hypothetical protein